jgi:hypothetical protein
MIEFDGKLGGMSQVVQIFARRHPEHASGEKGHPKTVRVAMIIDLRLTNIDQ